MVLLTMSSIQGGQTASLKVQQWGNSLAVRIPVSVVRAARFTLGQPVELSVGEVGLPVTTVGFNETNPFAIRLVGPKGAVGYILGHQPKSFDWRARNAKPHPWKQAPRNATPLGAKLC